MYSSFFSGAGNGVGAGLASGVIGGLLGGMNPAPTATTLPNQPGAASSLYSDIGGFSNPYPTVQPIEYQQMLAAMNNPNLAGYMRGAQTAGQGYDVAGGQAMAGGGLLMNDANSLYQMGFDPQQALYTKLQQQNQDQTNVANSMYGLQSSPYGAGVANQSNTNFNIDWQNQQLNRALQASQGIGRDVTGAQQMYGAGAQDFLAGGQVPYSAYNTALGDVNSAIGTYMGGAQQGNQLQSDPINAWLQYLGRGQGAVGANQTAFGMNQDTAGMYGSMLYPSLYQDFGSMFNSPPGGSTDVTPTMYSGPYASQLPSVGNFDYSNLQPVSGPGGP